MVTPLDYVILTQDTDFLPHVMEEYSMHIMHISFVEKKLSYKYSNICVIPTKLIVIMLIQLYLY